MASAYQDDFKLGRNSQIDFNAEEYNGETPIMLAASLLHFEAVEILLSDPRVIIEGLEKHVGIKIKGRKDDKQRMVDMVKKEAAHRLAQPKTQERPMVATDFIKEEHITKKSDEHNDQDGLTFTIDSRPEKVPQPATTPAEKGRRKVKKKNALRSAIQAAKKEDSDLVMHLSDVSEEPLDDAPAYSNEGPILTVRDSVVENFMGGDGPVVHAEAFEFSCWWHFMKAVEPNYKEKILSYLHNYLTKNE